MYAVIKTGGKQYKVSPGDRIKVEQLTADIGADVQFDQVLAVGSGGQIKVGAPLVGGAAVSATVLAQGRHPKVRIFKMRRRKHYQKHQGHRQNYTELVISQIESALGVFKAETRQPAVPPAGSNGSRRKTTADQQDGREQDAKQPAGEREEPQIGQADDLTRVEGIGPKIAEILQDAGIRTFTELSAAPVERLKELLVAAGSNFASHDPTTWPEQATLAARNDWDALGKLQAELDGGRRT